MIDAMQRLPSGFQRGDDAVVSFACKPLVSPLVESRPDERHRIGEFLQHRPAERVGSVCQGSRVVIPRRICDYTPRTFRPLERNKRNLRRPIPIVLHWIIVAFVVVVVLRAVAAAEGAVQFRSDETRVPSGNVERLADDRVAAAGQLVAPRIQPRRRSLHVIGGHPRKRRAVDTLAPRSFVAFESRGLLGRRAMREPFFHQRLANGRQAPLAVDPVRDADSKFDTFG
jgi:hypothetical protein